METELGETELGESPRGKNERGSAARRASGLAQRLKEDGRQTLEQRKRSAADRVEEIAQAIDRAGTQFSQNEPVLADYASRFATTVGNLATRLREGSVDDLVEDTRSFARRNPGLFLAGGIAAGFVLSRFVKASAQRTLEDLDDSPIETPPAYAPTLTDVADITTAHTTVSPGD
jgi:hypothetical protein